MSDSKVHRSLSLLAFLLITGACGWIGAQFEPGAWHAALSKPAWNPPNWVFAPVWTTLYLLIAVAGWRAWRERPTGSTRNTKVFWVLQLVLNGLWSWLFFGLHEPLWALVDIILLLIAITGFIWASFKHDRIAAWLFAPYLLWVAFATALNTAIWWLNS